MPWAACDCQLPVYPNLLICHRTCAQGFGVVTLIKVRESCAELYPVARHCQDDRRYDGMQ